MITMTDNDKPIGHFSREELQNLSKEELQEKIKEATDKKEEELFNKIFPESGLHELNEEIDHDGVKENARALFNYAYSEGVAQGFDVGVKSKYVEEMKDQMDEIEEQIEQIRDQQKSTKEQIEDLEYIG